MHCARCGEEHDLDELEPAFDRPDPWLALPAAGRERLGKAGDDFCRIDGPPARWFVRALLPIHVHGRELPLRWGIWAELSEAAFARVVEMWRSPDQADEPAFAARIANDVPGYPPTLGLACSLQLSGPTTRPFLTFAPEIEHPFAREQRAGVAPERALAWLHAILDG